MKIKQTIQVNFYTSIAEELEIDITITVGQNNNVILYGGLS